MFATFNTFLFQIRHRLWQLSMASRRIPYFIWPANVWKIICDFISLRLTARLQICDELPVVRSLLGILRFLPIDFQLPVIYASLPSLSLIMFYSNYPCILFIQEWWQQTFIWFDLILKNNKCENKYLYSSWMLYQLQKKKYWQLISFSRYGYRVRCNTGTFSTSWVIYIVTPDYTARNFMSHSVLSW